MVGRTPGRAGAVHRAEDAGAPWLRLAGATLFVVTASFWLFVLETEAPLVSLLLAIPFVVLAGPGWTHPRDSGIALLTGAGTYGLVLLRAVPHPILAELTLVVPLLCAGLLLIGSTISRSASAAREQ